MHACERECESPASGPGPGVGTANGIGPALGRQHRHCGRPAATRLPRARGRVVVRAIRGLYTAYYGGARAGPGSASAALGLRRGGEGQQAKRWGQAKDLARPVRARGTERRGKGRSVPAPAPAPAPAAARTHALCAIWPLVASERASRRAAHAPVSYCSMQDAPLP